MRLEHLISKYENLRSLLLGSTAGVEIKLPRANPGADGFDAFVSSLYVALRETLAEDVSFLTRIGVLRKHEVTRSVYLLRTARHHSDNPGAITFYKRWLGNEPIDWDNAAERLMMQAEGYLDSLVLAAQAVRESYTWRQQWVEAASVSVPSVFASVCQDLGLSFPVSAKNAKVRAIEGRYRRERLTGSKEKIISDLCVQEALSESGILPVNYSEILDELGLLRSRSASIALTLAYATARAHPNLKGDDFKRKTSEVWWSLIQT